MEDANEGNLKKFLNEMTLQIATKSSRSQNALTLYQQMMHLNKVVKDLDQIKDQDKNVVQQFYRSFRGLFKQYSDQNMKEIGNMSCSDNLSEEYLLEIKERLCKMTNSLQGLCNSIISNTSIHVLWYFINPSKYDKQDADYTIKYFRESYEKKSKVEFYTDKELFLKDIHDFGVKSNPIIAFISTSEYQTQKNILLETYRSIIDLKSKFKDIKMQGIILKVDTEVGYKDIQQEMAIEAEEKSTLNLVLTFDYFDIYNQVFKLMNPQEYRRVIPSSDINLYYHQMKTKFLELHIQDYTKYNLLDFHPDTIKLQKIIEEATELIKRRDIKVDPLILDPLVSNRLTKDILECYQEKTDQQIAKKLLRLYTLECCFLYKFINGCLNTLNEDVVSIIWDFILMLRIALDKYDDKDHSKIIISQNQAPRLYRGINLAQDYFNKKIKIDEIICFASFSSFSTEKHIAEQFIGQDKFFTKDRASIIFVYEYKICTDQFSLRPKIISCLGNFSNENEYLFPPSLQFKIFKIKKPTEQRLFYKVYLTQGIINQFTKN